MYNIKDVDVDINDRRTDTLIDSVHEYISMNLIYLNRSVSQLIDQASISYF